jgi:hypothetical protein
MLIRSTRSQIEFSDRLLGQWMSLQETEKDDGALQCHGHDYG